MSHSLSDYLFGPLGKNYCLYFYVIAVVAFVFMVMMMASAVVGLFTAKKIDMKLLTGILIGIAYWFVLYLQSRLLYNMCYHSEGSEGMSNPAASRGFVDRWRAWTAAKRNAEYGTKN
jgi:hypothetical protein